MNTCPCSRPTQSFLCNECVREMVNDLRSVPDLIGQLTETSSAMKAPARSGMPGGGSGGSRAPGDFNALCHKGTLEHLLLSMWISVGHSPVAGLDPSEYVDGITSRVNALAKKPAIESYKNQLHDEIQAAERTLAGPEHIIRLGACTAHECGTPLTAHEGEHETRCTTCGETYNITKYWEARALTALGHDGTPVRAAQAVRYLNKRGVRVTTKDVENWVAGKKLVEVDRDDSKLKRRLFNIQDVYTLALGKKDAAA